MHAAALAPTLGIGLGVLGCAPVTVSDPTAVAPSAPPASAPEAACAPPGCPPAAPAAPCQADVQSDPNNCGACGVSCGQPPNTVAVGCVAGKCVLQTCQGGFADCDQVYKNGCEVNLFASVSQCGQCGYACPVPANALTASCTKPLGCGVGSCQAGYGDCDGLVWNGCEAKLDSDVRNCGGCGQACGTYFSMEPSCRAGQCTFACTAELYDVDGRLVNGCETQDVPLANHSQSQARSVGSVTACDKGVYTNQIVGTIPSDLREHPSLAARSNGTVEDWYSIEPLGESSCARDLGFQINTTSSGALTGPCFVVTFITDQGRFAAQTASSGSATGTAPAKAYTPQATIYVKVEKSVQTEACAAAQNADVQYFINFHL